MSPNKENAIKKIFFSFGTYWTFLAKKQPKFYKNEENWKNPNCLKKFPEVWYVDASQQKKMQWKIVFWFRHLLALFGQKAVKIDQ